MVTWWCHWRSEWGEVGEEGRGDTIHALGGSQGWREKGGRRIKCGITDEAIFYVRVRLYAICFHGGLKGHICLQEHCGPNYNIYANIVRNYQYILHIFVLINSFTITLLDIVSNSNFRIVGTNWSKLEWTLTYNEECPPPQSVPLFSQSSFRERSLSDVAAMLTALTGRW